MIWRITFTLYWVVFLLSTFFGRENIAAGMFVLGESTALILHKQTFSETVRLFRRNVAYSMPLVAGLAVFLSLNINDELQEYVHHTFFITYGTMLWLIPHWLKDPKNA